MSVIVLLLLIAVPVLGMQLSSARQQLTAKDRELQEAMAYITAQAEAHQALLAEAFTALAGRAEQGKGIE